RGLRHRRSVRRAILRCAHGRRRFRPGAARGRTAEETTADHPGEGAQMTTTPREYEVVVIGAGFAGICAAIKLRQAGIHDFVVVDKADGVGGVWHENTYPDVGVD